jgi:dCMP deaminase
MDSSDVERAASRAVGAVLRCKTGTLFLGYEGAPHGMFHCDMVGCLMTPAGVCANAVRAELNALLRAARAGESTVGATLEVSAPLHSSMVGAIINAGVTRVECVGPLDKGIRAALSLANIEVEEHDEGRQAVEEASEDSGTGHD